MVEKQEKKKGPPGKKAPNWKPGQSGNPKGRPPKRDCLTSLMKEIMDEVPPIQIGGKKNTKTYKQLLVEATVRLALKGNATALREVWDRVDGKVKEQIEHSGEFRVVRFPVRASDRNAWLGEQQKQLPQAANGN